MSLSSSGPAPGANRERTTASLRPDYLSFSDVIGQSVGTIAPAGATALSTGMVFAAAGNGTSLAYVFATVSLLLAASSINQFARRGASAGGLYVFTGSGLGATLGVV